MRFLDTFFDGAVMAKYLPELLSAIPSRCAAHPTLPAIAAATSSGRIHVFRK